MTTSNLTRAEKHQFGIDARAFIAESSEARGICKQLYAELVSSQFLHEFAFQDEAERFVARQEAWATAISAQIAETVRAAFRAAEADMRWSMRRAQEMAWGDDRAKGVCRLADYERAHPSQNGKAR